MGWNGGLRALAVREVGSEADRLDWRALRRDAKFEWSARIKMPDLHCVDAVPVRSFARLQQKVDGGRAGTAVGAGLIAKRFAKVSALRMRREPEQVDDVLR